MAKKYHVSGRELRQEPITIAQFSAILDFAARIKIDEEVSIFTLIKELTNKHLAELMAIVFPSQDISGIDWQTVDCEIVDRIGSDFLALNPRLAGRLKQFALSLKGMLENPVS